VARKRAKLPSVPPGETLLEDFLKPLGLSANRLALELRVPVTRVSEIVHGRRSITADTALRLARYFGTSPQFWINLQTNYYLEVAQDAAGSEQGGEAAVSRYRPK
jgi:addiction module HigA family antidote